MGAADVVVGLFSCLEQNDCFVLVGWTCCIVFAGQSCYAMLQNELKNTSQQTLAHAYLFQEEVAYISLYATISVVTSQYLNNADADDKYQDRFNLDLSTLLLK